MIRAALIALGLLAAPVAGARELGIEKLGAIIDRSGLEGDVVIADGRNGEEPPFHGGYSHVGLLPEPYRGGYDGVSWRWTAVTRQIVAILVAQQVAAGKIDPDKPVGAYLRDVGQSPVTVRALLQRRGDLSAFHRICARLPASPKAEPVDGACHALVLGAVLEAVTGDSWDKLFRERIAGPLGLEHVGAYPGEAYTRWGFADGKRETAFDLAPYGAAGGLWGSPDALVAIDLALMRGKLLPADMTAAFLNSDAFGQDGFEVRLAGCDAPVRVVESGGRIGGVAVRNYLVPAATVVVAIFSHRAPFDFGDLRAGRGLAHDLLSETICTKGAS